MEPTTEQEILKALKGLNNRLDESESDYCNSAQAMTIISLTKQQQLKYLLNKGLIIRYPRGNGFRYKKSECRKVGEKIDIGEIKIPTF
jgi:hypothetical protein